MSETVVLAALDRPALNELAEMTGGDPEFLAELIETFLGDSPKLVAEMQAAAAGGDTAALRRAAHTLKSNSRTFGATALGTLCQEIEQRAAAGEDHEVTDLIGRILVEYPAVIAALRAERPGA